MTILAFSFLLVFLFLFFQISLSSSLVLTKQVECQVISWILFLCYIATFGVNVYGSCIQTKGQNLCYVMLYYQRSNTPFLDNITS